jgi:hypothetical protein
MKDFHLHWIPQELTASLRQILMETCRELFPILMTHENNKFQRFVTGGKSCFTLECHHSTNFSVSRNDVPQKVKQQIGTQNFMLIVIWGIDGFYVVDLLTEQHGQHIVLLYSYFRIIAARSIFRWFANRILVG